MNMNLQKIVLFVIIQENVRFQLNQNFYCRTILSRHSQAVKKKHRKIISGVFCRWHHPRRGVSRQSDARSAFSSYTRQSSEDR